MFVNTQVVEIIQSGRGVGVVQSRCELLKLVPGMYIAIDPDGSLWKVNAQRSSGLHLSPICENQIRYSILVPPPIEGAKALSANDINKFTVKEILAFYGIVHKPLTESLEAKMLGNSYEN